MLVEEAGKTDIPSVRLKGHPGRCQSSRPGDGRWETAFLPFKDSHITREKEYANVSPCPALSQQHEAASTLLILLHYPNESEEA